MSKEITVDWIPVSERLPENDEIVLVTCKTKKGVKSVNRAYYSDGYWHGSGSMSGVTAWVPTPAPYDEENDTKKKDPPKKISSREI